MFQVLTISQKISLVRKGICLFFILLFMYSAKSQNREYNADLDLLLSELEVRHPSLYNTTDKSDFIKAINILKSKTSSLTKNQLLLEIEKILSLVNDGHTTLLLFASNEVNYTRLPFKLWKLNEGYVVLSTVEKYNILKGKLITHIDRNSIYDLEQAFKNSFAVENEYGHSVLMQEYVTVPALLQAKGLISDTSNIKIIYQDLNGKIDSMVIGTILRNEYLRLPFIEENEAVPKWLQNRGKKFWKEFDSQKNILYIQLNSSDIGGLEAQLRDFSREILEEVKDGKVKKIILDVRRNFGGSYIRTRPLFHSLLAINQLNPDIPQYVFIDNYTYSAGAYIAGELNEHTNALFVGKPTSGKPQFFGDLHRLKLPHIGITVRYSRLAQVSTNVYDSRPAIMPDLYASYSYKDFFYKDPCFELLDIADKKSLDSGLLFCYQRYGIDSLFTYYNLIERDSINTYSFNETTLLSISGHIDSKDRIKLLEFNTSKYPWSWMGFVSLGDAYMAAGYKNEAEQVYKKAFKINKYAIQWRELKFNEYLKGK